MKIHITPEELAKHPVVSPDEWLKARLALLELEKEQTRRQDALAAARRALPWQRVEKDYEFEGPDGRQSLADLFDGRSQLIIYHFMFGPDWDEGCAGCSFLVDHIDGANLHLPHKDVSLVVVSHAPWAKLAPFKQRMGWKFKWVSSGSGDFNFDYQASATKEELTLGKMKYNFRESDVNDEMPGLSVFYKNPQGQIFHTYSGYERAGDILLGAHNYLDFTPKGRNESETMDWLRHHDKYDQPAPKDCCGG